MSRPIYFVDGTNGRVFRTVDLTATTPVYEDLGQVDSGGLYWIALDEFDKENRAMVCGPNGVWSTTDLSAASPSWTLEISPPAANWKFYTVRSSPIQDQLWMVAGAALSGGGGYTAGTFGVWWTENDGTSWSSNTALYVDGSPPDNGPHLEMSSHDYQIAWFLLHRSDGSYRVRKTTDLWSTNSETIFSTACFQAATIDWDSNRPCSDHRDKNNSDDSNALWVSVKSGGTDYIRSNICDADTGGTCNCNTIGSVAGTVSACACGTYYDTEDERWALANCGGFKFYYTSDSDGASWTNRYSFTGTVHHCVGWPDNATHFVATHDGAVYPLLLSVAGGFNFTAKNGNWGTLGYTGDIKCCAVGADSGYAFTPVGQGLPHQAMDVDGNGDILYLALYNGSANPVLIEVALPLTASVSTGTIKYNPGAGDAINVKAHYEVANYSITTGYFGNNEQAQKRSPTAGTYSDIDPGTWGTNRAQPLAIDPNDYTHALVTLDSNNDLVEKDSADSWTTLDAALTFVVSTLAIFDLEPDEIFIGNTAAAASLVRYSPNNGSTWSDITGALPVTAGIANIEVV